MALTVKNKLIIEDIIDENGTKIGEIKFNPEDSRIMQKLSKIVNDLEEAMKEIDNIGDIPDLSEKKLETIEDFEEQREIFQKIYKGFNIELSVVEKAFNDLNEVFGKDTIDTFTQRTMDITMVMPLIEYVMPYVKKYRQNNVNKYLKKKNQVETLDVME